MKADVRLLALTIAGWTYRARTLDSAVRVLTPTAAATVLQDDLSNTYQLIESN